MMQEKGNTYFTNINDKISAIPSIDKDKKSVQMGHPLMCWDIASLSTITSSRYIDLVIFQKLAITHEWELGSDFLQDKQFDALVVTNMHQKIKWVSQGFKKMTGYSPSYALHKSPNFLQGNNSSKSSRSEIREAIMEQKTVSTSLINYRKDGSEYNCHIEIIPLFTHQNKLAHFLAIEKLQD